MIVKNILLGRRGNVVTIEPTADLAAAVKRLAERRIGALVILGADHRIVGILSERDIVRAFAERGPAALHEPVGQVMTRDVKTCSEDDTIESLMGRMTTGNSAICRWWSRESSWASYRLAMWSRTASRRWNAKPQRYAITSSSNKIVVHRV